MTAGKPCLLKIDLQGARQVRQAMPERTLVFLAPPTWAGAETAPGRARHRRRGDDPAPAGARAGGAGGRAEFDVTIVNHFVEQAADDLLGLLGLQATH